jgi:hypothetical protein
MLVAARQWRELAQKVAERQNTMALLMAMFNPPPAVKYCRGYASSDGKGDRAQGVSALDLPFGPAIRQSPGIGPSPVSQGRDGYASSWSSRSLGSPRLLDGVYGAETAIDGYLDGDDPAKRELPIVVTITKKDDSLLVDLTGTAPQVPDCRSTCRWKAPPTS